MCVARMYACVSSRAHVYSCATAHLREALPQCLCGCSNCCQACCHVGVPVLFCAGRLTCREECWGERIPPSPPGPGRGACAADFGSAGTVACDDVGGGVGSAARSPNRASKVESPWGARAWAAPFREGEGWGLDRGILVFEQPDGTVYTCVYINVRVRMCASMLVRVLAHVCAPACVCVRVCARACVCTCASTCMCACDCAHSC